jgi:hypothetical protein
MSENTGCALIVIVMVLCFTALTIASMFIPHMGCLS